MSNTVIRSNAGFLPLMGAVGFAMSMTAPIELIYAKRFGIGAIGLGLFIVTTSVGMVAIDVFGTRAVPRVGARAAMVGGIVLFGASVFVLGVAPSVPVLLIGRVLQGFGAGLLFGAALQAAVRVHQPRDRAIARFSAAFLLGGAVGAPIGGIVAGVASGDTGYRLAFVLCAALCVLTAVALRRSLPVLGADPQLPIEFGLPRLSGNPGLGRALVLATIGDFVRGGVVYSALPLAGDSRHLSTALIGTIIGVLSAVEIVLLAASGRFADRLGPINCIIGSLLLGVIAAFLLASPTGLAGYVVGAVLFGFVVAGTTFGAPVMMMAFADDESAGLARFRISSGIGMTVGSTGMGVTTAAVGSTEVFALLAAILLAGVGLARHVGRTMPQTLVAQR